jgi:plasmid maintenance system antidote protein VapI
VALVMVARLPDQVVSRRPNGWGASPGAGRGAEQRLQLRRPRASRLPVSGAVQRADTALRLSRFFGASERFWINLQSRYGLEVEKDRLGDVLDGIRPLTAAS